MQARDPGSGTGTGTYHYHMVIAALTSASYTGKHLERLDGCATAQTSMPLLDQVCKLDSPHGLMIARHSVEKQEIV